MTYSILYFPKIFDDQKALNGIDIKGTGGAFYVYNCQNITKYINK